MGGSLKMDITGLDKDISSEPADVRLRGMAPILSIYLSLPTIHYSKGLEYHARTFAKFHGFCRPSEESRGRS